MRFLPGNAQHIGARQSQQDSFGFADPDDQAFIAHGGFLAIVCDGMGGMEHGDFASRTAVRTFLDAYRRKTPQESIPAALERSVFEANASVVELARRFGMVEGIGTTLVATALIDRAMFYISVGDSGIFHVSGGQIQTVNRPHVFANLLDQAVARGQIKLEEALAHPERESLTSYIGAEKIEEIDANIDPWPLQDGDTVLLASDGMFKTLEPGEILACLRGNPPSWPEMLVEQTLAKQREFQDNVTVLSVTIESEARATVPRTVLMAPPPPSAAGVPVESQTAIPRTVALPLTVGPLVSPATVPVAPLSNDPLPSTSRPLSPPPAWDGPWQAQTTPLAPTEPPLSAGSPPLAHARPAPTVQATPAGPFPPMAAPSPAWTPVEPPAALPQWQPPSLNSPASPRRSSVLMLVILAVLAAAGAGGWWFWTHRPTPLPFGGRPDPAKQLKAQPRDPAQPIPPRRSDEVQPPRKEP
jgi:serine/threonine protein phosphatase PrpC